MLTEVLMDKIKEIGCEDIRFNELLANHSTMKIGGNAGAFIVPENREQLAGILALIKEEGLNYFILGAGSNVLFRDSGFDGVVISLEKFKGFNVEEKTDDAVRIEAECGVMVNDIVNFGVEESVHGFEHLAGIPGSLGGALHMNAGTHNGSVSDVLIEVAVLDKAGRDFVWPKEKIEFGYRKAKYPRSCVIISGKFLLKRGDHAEIEKTANELRERRKERHPLTWPSCGSVFKNPEKGPSAGELIEDVGLRGVRVGGARISEKHGNWIVNEKNATAKDVEVLIHLVREKVREIAGVSLETEVVIVGSRE